MLTAEEWEIVGLTLQVAGIAVLLIAVPGVALAYGLARGRVPAPFLVQNLVQVPLVLPPVVTGWLLLAALGPGSVVGGWLEATLGLRPAFHWTGAALAAGVVAFPLLVQTARVAFEQVDPAWEEAARVYGGGRWAVWRHVTLPLAARGLAAGVALAFARAVGEFGATIVLAGNIAGRTQTLPLAVFSRLHQVGGEAAAMRLVWVALVLSALSLMVHAGLSRRLHADR